MQQSEIFDVSYTNLTHLENNIPETVKKLNISHNNITRIPEWSTLLSSLLEFHASKNTIAQLPQFFNNPLLKIISLSYNNLDSRTIELARFELLPHLQVLDLSFNCIVEFPVGCCGIAVRKLGLSNNKLKTLPSEFSRMKNLQYLGLGYNEFETVPQVLGECGSLVGLNYAGNAVDENSFKLLKRLNVGVLSVFEGEGIEKFKGDGKKKKKKVGSMNSLDSAQ